MGPRKMGRYISQLWEYEGSLLRIYFNRFTYFQDQLNIELSKLDGTFKYRVSENNSEYEIRDIEELSLIEIGKYYPEK